MTNDFPFHSRIFLKYLRKTKVHLAYRLNLNDQ
jgi:hypothetical protein